MVLPRLPLSIDTRTLRSFDGTELAYHVTPAPFEGAPVAVLANGLGGTYLAWRGIIDYLRDRVRFITWDYRGLYESKRPSPDRAEAYAIENQARDLVEILRAEKVERASLVGWSMGVQVVLETYRARPDLAIDLVLLNGSFGRPLDTLSPLPGMKMVLPPLVELARRAHAFATPMARRATEQPEAAAWFKRLGLVGETLDVGVFNELVAAFGALDMEPFFRNLSAIGAHDASAVLETIAVPALVITGDKDLFMPRSLAQEMARRIPRADLLVVRGGTHYTAVEYPELVSLRIERFYRDHGFL